MKSHEVKTQPRKRAVEAIEQHYSPRSVAKLLDLSYETVRNWIKLGRLRVIKTGVAKSSPVLITASELRRFLDR